MARTKPSTLSTTGIETTELPRIEWVSIDALRRNPKNARTHSPRQTRQIAASIRKFGFLNPILVNDTNMVLAGHGRLEAARHSSSSISSARARADRCTIAAGTWCSPTEACASAIATGTCSSVMPPQPWRSSRCPRPNSATWSRSFRVSRKRLLNSKDAERLCDRGARAGGRGTRRREGRNLKKKHESLAIEQQNCLGSASVIVERSMR
jgi:hypothetical protein